MSSSNRVRITTIAETVLGETPVAGNFKTTRFISESLSGSPGTTESQQIRSDRLSSGQVVTSLELGGDVNFELAKEAAFDEYLESAMLNAWDVQVLQTVDITIVGSTSQLTRASGDWNTTLDVGDIILLAGFSNTVNNVHCQVTKIVSATVILVAPVSPLVNETGSGTTYKRLDRLSIGTTKKSFSICKEFLDLTTKGINYKGMLVNTFSLNLAYGEIVSGTFGFNGTEYSVANLASELITNGRTIDSAAVSQSMNGSIDMPFIAASIVSADIEEIDFCIQNITLNLNNNMTAQNCIGRLGPIDYSPGTAAIEVSMSTYLSNENYDALDTKLSQAPFGLGFLVKNLDGLYGFFLPAVQVSADDPSSQGANQEVSLELNGVAKVGANGESSLFVYRS